MLLRVFVTTSGPMVEHINGIGDMELYKRSDGTEQLGLPYAFMVRVIQISVYTAIKCIAFQGHPRPHVSINQNAYANATSY